MSLPRFEVFAGKAWSRQFKLRADDLSTITTWTTAATVTAGAWVGDDQAAAFSLSVDKSLIASGLLTLSIAGADTSALAPALYRVWLEIESQRKTVGLIDLKAVPAAATAPKVYCSYDDVKRFAPWIGDLIASDPSLQSDLGEQREQARARLDDAILAHYQPLAKLGLASGNAHLMWTTAGQGDPIDGPSTWLRDQLDADLLMTSGTRGRVVQEITARLAIGFACEPQLGKGPGDTPYQAIAQRQFAKAYALMRNYRAEIDLNADGSPDLVVSLGVLSCR